MATNRIPQRVYRKETDWADYIAAMNSGDTLEIDEAIYEYTLGVLPPIFMNRTIKGQHYAFGFAEGAETIVGFWRTPDGHFFCRDTGIMNRPW